MQPKALILLAAALQSANILAAPVASPADAGALAFNNPGYYREYRVATDSGLVDKEKREAVEPTAFGRAAYRSIYRESADAGLAEEEKRDEKVQTYGKLYLGAKDAAEEKEKRTSLTPDPNVVDNDKEKEKRQIGFHTASYAHLYKDAADEGLAEEKAKERRQTEFRTAAYAHLYKEAADKGLVERDAEKEQIYSLVLLRKEGEGAERVARQQTYKPSVLA